MADDIIVISEGSGKNLQSFKNTIGVNVVHAEAIVLVDSSGAVISLIDNKLRVSSMPYLYDIAEGNVVDHIAREILGYDPAVGATLEDITELGVNVTPVPASAIAMEVVSTSNDDDGAPVGTGARTVEIHGLDTNWDMVSELLTLNGLNSVDCVETYRRINNFHVMTVGSGGVAAGTISLQADGAGTEYNRIEAGGNMTLQCHYTVPDDYTLYIVGWHAGLATTNKNTIARAILRTTADWDDRTLTSGVFHSEDILIGQASSMYNNLPIPLKCPARCDIKVSAQTITGAAIVQASAGVQFWMEK